MLTVLIMHTLDCIINMLTGGIKHLHGELSTNEEARVHVVNLQVE